MLICCVLISIKIKPLKRAKNKPEQPTENKTLHIHNNNNNNHNNHNNNNNNNNNTNNA